LLVRDGTVQEQLPTVAILAPDSVYGLDEFSPARDGMVRPLALGLEFFDYD